MAESKTSKKASLQNKKVLIGIGGVLLLFVLLGGYMVLGKKMNSQEATQKESGNVFTSIKDALSKSVSLQCEYTDETGNTTTAYIKAGAIRTNTVGKDPQNSGSVIMKDTTMYGWQGTQGFTMTFDPKDMMDDDDSYAETGDQKPGDIVAGLEKFKDNCKPAVVADSLFTPPADVQFTDFSAMMENAKKQQAPNGSMTEEQIKALQKQYEQ